MAMKMPQYNCTHIDDFINVLNNPVGYLEKATTSNLGDWTESGKVVNAGYSNYTLYWQWYKEQGLGNLQGEPYCAGAVSTMFIIAFGHDKMKKLLCGNGYHFCPTGYNNFKAKGRIYSTPKKGDVIFFWSTSLGRWSHTGIVIGVDSNGKGYTTWEANTSSGNDIVVRNGGATCRKHYTLGGGKKVAFGRPDYEGNGICLSAKPNYDVTYDIGTGVSGLLVTASSLNIRNNPGNGTIIGSFKSGSKVYPTKKTFIDGDPWVYDPNTNGWISAKYLTGWMIEYTNGNKWWYVLPGYQWYTSQIVNIDGYNYFFGDDGYMFTGTITFTTDANGVLKKATMTEQ